MCIRDSRICILHSGDILQYDTPENILKNPADGFVSEFVGSKPVSYTHLISYPVSAGVIMTLMALLIGFAPNPETGKLFGTAAGLGIGLKGFASTAFCLVAAAMFLAVAMTKTGLDKRIALVILSKPVSYTHLLSSCSKISVPPLVRSIFPTLPLTG